MFHRLGSAFAIVSTLLFPVVASAQTAQPVWLGPSRPLSPRAYAQPAYPQARPQPAYPQPYAQPAYPQPYAQPAYPQAYAQPTYPQAQAQPAYAQASYRPAYAAPAYPSAPRPVPASYGYTGYPGYGGSYYAPNYYASNYAQGNQVAAGSWGAPGREAPAPLVETKDNLHYVQMGMGAFVPTDQGNNAKAGLEASLWALHGGWVPNSGLYMTLDASTGLDLGCMAKRATDGCKGHLRIHWIGAGPFFNTGTPMIARDVPRTWDLMALTGAEVRLWKGLTAKATINWFLPSPWGVYAYEKERAEANVSGTASAARPATPGMTTGEAQVPNPVDDAGSIFGHALKHPQVNLMAMWEF